jgi:hypothetical protein
MGKKGIGSRLIVFGQINSGGKLLSGEICEFYFSKLHGMALVDWVD